MLLVSVIIPNYNHAAYLRQRIESVLNQTYQDFEVIILDDCSSDDSREIIESFKSNPKVKHIVYNETNSGSTFRQWKKGIELAEGEWIWIAESDDVADNCFLEKILDTSCKNKSASVFFVKSRLIDETGRTIRADNMKNQNSIFDSDLSMEGKDFVRQYMLWGNSIPNASAVVFKKSIYNKIGGVNTSYTINGDWNLYCRLLSKGDIRYIGEELNCFRQHSIKGSFRNIRNGNNIKEYYWLALILVDWFRLDVSEVKKLRLHIFRSWYSREASGIGILLTKKFYNILPAAWALDKMIVFRIIKGMVLHYFRKVNL